MSRFTERVWMRHDELDRTIQFFRSQVPELGAAGWYEVDPPPPPEPKPRSKQELAKQESTPSGRSRPRPSSKEQDS